MSKTRVQDNILTLLIWAFSLLTIGILILILGFVLINGVPHINWTFLTANYKRPFYGILPMIVTTLYVIALTLAIATPIGICSAIYLNEYAKPGKILSLIRFATESLSGIPSIVYGLFGYIFFGIVLKMGFAIVTGALTLSIMVLPTIIRTTEEALKTVPLNYREGSLALGATKLTTIRKVILPCAIPGILTAVILSIGRIVGETAAVIFTVGTAAKYIPEGLADRGRTLAVHLFQLAKEGVSLHQSYATAAVLVIIVAFINFAANRIASRLSRSTMGR